VCSVLAPRDHGPLPTESSCAAKGDIESPSKVPSLSRSSSDPVVAIMDVNSCPTPSRLRRAATALVSSHLSPTKPFPAEGALEGRRRSLLVGINYYDTQDELHGCVNDVARMLPALSALGFPSDDENQRVLTDGPNSSAEQQPTRANILAAFAWLAEDAQPGDVLFFHYSGHGGRYDTNSSSGQRWRESLVPVDYETAGLLPDREVSKELLQKLPADCRLTCLIDSCHSTGSPLALPAMFLGDMSSICASASGHSDQRWGTNSKAPKPAAEVIVITGCDPIINSGSWPDRGGAIKDDQLCLKRIGNAAAGSKGDDIASLYIDKSRAAGGSNWGCGGTLTSVFLEALPKEGATAPTLLNMLEKIHQDFDQKRIMQAPLIVSSKPLSLMQRFAVDAPLADLEGH